MFLNIALNTVSFAAKANVSYFTELSKISDVVRIVKQGYVEEDKAKDTLPFVEGAIEGILKKLEDPFTRYIPARNYESMQEDIGGGFGGIGITWTREEDCFRVISPMEGTPAFMAGIRAQDKILQIDGHDTREMTIEEGSKLMKGEVKSKVKLLIGREGEDEPIAYEITRDFIEVTSVRSGFLETGFGYVRLTGFTATTGEDLQESLEAMENSTAIKGLVMDLRGNPGGLLEAAVAVSEQFLKRDELVVSIRDRKGSETKLLGKGSGSRTYPVVVLIDQGSASAAEIVAGAIKDTGRGLLLGMKSFGKGSVQTVMPLGDGSAIALTTAYYFTPAGIRIHGKGIEPDVKVEFPKLKEEEMKKYREELVKHNQENIKELTEKQKALLEKGEKVKLPPGQIPISQFDPQLKRAHELMKAVSIFGSI